ncbi:hypothetical protein CcrBL47_gp239c [Caulobacter phage BL47]|nr:hypothetical protein CcrBL47_gp239c [Caulobacter phage BL47]
MAFDTVDEPIIARERLYKYDSKGKLRVWYMERQGNKHRVVAGLADGKLTTSKWTVCKGKQKRTDEEQAIFEINADYTYGLKRDYFLTPEEATGGARFFEPQLANRWIDTTWDKWLGQLKKAKITPKAGTTGAYFQPKLDGFCCIAQKSGLTTREGEPIVSVPHIMEALAPTSRPIPTRSCTANSTTTPCATSSRPSPRSCARRSTSRRRSSRPPA